MSIVLAESVIEPQSPIILDQRPKIHIRLAQVEDAEFLGELWLIHREHHKQWDELYASVPTARFDWVNQLIDWLQKDNHCVLVVEDEYGNILGYIHGSYHSWSVSPFGHYGSLNSLCVAEDVRGRDLGKKLISALLEWFRESQIQHISLHVDHRNLLAFNLYQGVGFQPYQHRLMLTIEY